MAATAAIHTDSDILVDEFPDKFFASVPNCMMFDPGSCIV
jgi:hypothetical protein